MKTAIEHKTLTLGVKSLDESGHYRIYAAIFGNRDRANEVIAPNAFKNLDDFVRDGFMATNHQWSSLPIGTVDSAVQDRVGLLVEERFHSTDEAQSCRKVMKERLDRGKTVSASIGYTVLDDQRMVESGQPYRLLKSINLWELSFVNVPCNPKAVALSVKGGLQSRRAPLAAIKKAIFDFEVETFDDARYEKASPEAMLRAARDLLDHLTDVPASGRRADPDAIAAARLAYIRATGDVPRIRSRSRA
jgi:HK97 family phage prohead protease